VTSTPGSFDGATGDVFDSAGRRVARVALDDQRTETRMPSGRPGRVEGEVLGCFEDAELRWASDLPRLVGGSVHRSMIVSIELDNGERFEDVQVSPPWDDGVVPIHSLYFPLSHEHF
jgi:hypothetical protein